MVTETQTKSTHWIDKPLSSSADDAVGSFYYVALMNNASAVILEVFFFNSYFICLEKCI